MKCHIQFGLLVNTINARPCIQHVKRDIFKETKYHSMKLTTHFQLELSLKICGAIPAHMTSGQAQEQLYLYNAAC